MADISIDEVADAMYEMIARDAGKKKYKAGDLQKAMIEKFGSDKCGRKECKAAIRQLIDSGKCVYTYFGGSFIEVPHEEGAAQQ
jgi:hypothetical protein